MGVDHSNTVTVTIVLSALPPSRAGFGIPLLLVDKATNTLNGERVASYTSAAEAETAQTAGYISASTLAALQAAFSQVPAPATVKVANHNTAGAETLSACLAAIEALDTDWYGTAIYSRVDADIVAWGALIETRNKFYVAQSDDAAWLTGAPPAGLSTIMARERTAVIWHDEDTEPADLAWLAARLVFDPDVQSAPWSGQVRGVEALTDGLTSAQRGFLIDTNDANVGLPFSSADYYVSPGQNMAGRGIYEILSGDWFKARISEDIQLLKLTHDNRGEKIIVDGTGQAKVLAILNGRLQQGVNAGHFVRGQTRATAYAITSADLTARRLRFKVEAQIAADAYLFDFNVYMSSDELQAE